MSGTKWSTTPGASPVPPRRGDLAAWVVLAALTAGALIAVNVFHLAPGGRRLLELTAGERILDMRPTGYGPADVHRLLTLLGAEGRGLYLRLLWTLDVTLPALFSSFLWSSVSLGALRRWRWVAALGGVADYLENVAVTALLHAFPAESPALVAVASALTVVKWVLYLGGGALALAGAVRGRLGHGHGRQGVL